MREIAPNFWNFRGDFKLAKIINLGTHMSLIRRGNGLFLLLDSYELEGDELEKLMELTDGGKSIEAILNVHPFHTLHCAAVHKQFPHARLIGTRRHAEEVPDLPWEGTFIEDAETQAEFSDELQFSVPGGVDFISDDDGVHTASVLIRHRASGVVHADDTINVFAAPGALGELLPQTRLRFHPKLSDALQKRLGAADEYAAWARQIAETWSGTPAVCAAHSAVRELEPLGWREEILKALDDVEETLADHRKKYG